MRSTAFLGLIVIATCAVGTPACFPDYSIASGGSGGETGGSGGGAGDAGSGGAGGTSTGGTGGTGGAAGDAGSGGSGGSNVPGMARLDPPDNFFDIRARDVSGMVNGSGTVTFTRPFLVDETEVTVGRFRDWINKGRPVPCESGSCPLDEGGAYEATMVWDSAWNDFLLPHTYSYENGMGCTAPGVEEPTTYEVGVGGEYDLPMTCVSWYEAAALCASEQKRLLTHAEWIYVATGGTALKPYPWGDEAPTNCDLVIWRDEGDFCDFPVDVGTAEAGETTQGVYDMAGSVFEWVWDARWEAVPQGGVDYTGPGGEGTDRIRKGGAFIVPEFDGDDRMMNEVFEAHPPTAYYADAGFRCARTVLP